MSSLSIRSLRKSFGDAVVLHDIDLEVADGEFVVFVGPSGCGKSTLLRCIAGLEEISGGDLLIDGRRMNDVPPAKRGIAMVFQSYALYPHMTVAENMSFSLKMAGLPPAQIEAKVREAAEILQITHLLARRPAALSGGQRQRVAIGRSIVRQPGVFLFDEPLSNLDAALRGQMRMELARLHRSLATTIVYVTHDQAEAMTLADRIVVFNGGRIEQIGAPMDIYQRPANRFVAGFIGAPKINLLDGAVRDARDGQLSLALDDDCLLTLPRAANGLRERDRVTLGIRPENVRLAAPPCAHASAATRAATVQMVEHLGDVTYLHASARSGAAVTVRTAPDTALRAGESVHLEFPLGDCLLFAADGAALAL